MFYVYVLKNSENDNFYTGCTEDLRKRLMEHNNGKVTTTRKFRNWKVVYYEASLDIVDAFAREKYLKSGPGKRYLRQRLKRFLSLTG